MIEKLADSEINRLQANKSITDLNFDQVKSLNSYDHSLSDLSIGYCQEIVCVLALNGKASKTEALDLCQKRQC